MNINIREGIPADATGVARVSVDCWRSAYREFVPQNILDGLSYAHEEPLWANTLREPHKEFVYVVENEAQEIVGFVSGGPALLDETLRYQGELFSLYILDAYQRQGLGRRLFFQVVERLLKLELSSMLIWVLTENPARRFYEKLGGTLVSTGSFHIQGTDLPQVAYGWPDITQLK